MPLTHGHLLYLESSRPEKVRNGCGIIGICLGANLGTDVKIQDSVSSRSPATVHLLFDSANAFIK